MAKDKKEKKQKRAAGEAADDAAAGPSGREAPGATAGAPPGAHRARDKAPSPAADQQQQHDAVPAAKRRRVRVTAAPSDGKQLMPPVAVYFPAGQVPTDAKLSLYEAGPNLGRGAQKLVLAGTQVRRQASKHAEQAATSIEELHRGAAILATHRCLPLPRTGARTQGSVCFVGRTHGEEYSGFDASACRQALAVHDKSTGQLHLLPLAGDRVLRMEPRLPGLNYDTRAAAAAQAAAAESADGEMVVDVAGAREKTLADNKRCVLVCKWHLHLPLGEADEQACGGVGLFWRRAVSVAAAGMELGPPPSSAC